MRQAFSPIEAWVYDRFLAAGVVTVVAPLVEDAIGDARRVLDVGCAGGRLTHRLGAVGVEPSPPSPTHAPMARAVAGALPFGDDRFDAVVSSCSIKHWPDVAAGMTECRRVLRPGGVLVVVEMDRDGTLLDLRRWADLTHVPRPLRRAYARFDQRVALPMAPTVAELGAMVGSPATKVDGLPYAIVVHHPT
jgi:SAM-dependent methyltransferase